MRREDNAAQSLTRASEPWDIVIIGGGATGMGVAVDAAARGFSVVLVEAHDFGKGTSSRSTKLVHGGVRYLEQGNIPLVMSALKERGLLRQNAPHLVHDLAFVVPNYSWWEAPFYGIGLKLYDLLAGKYGFGASKLLSKRRNLERLPALEPEGPARRRGLLRRPVRRRPAAHPSGHDRGRSRRNAGELLPRNRPAQRCRRLRERRNGARRGDRRGAHDPGAHRGERDRRLH